MENHIGEPLSRVSHASSSQKTISRTLIFVVAGIAVLSVIGVGILYQSNLNLERQVAEQQSLLSTLSSKVEQVSVQSDYVRTLALLSAIQHDMEGTVVTDDFVVERINLLPVGNGGLQVAINLDTQPGMLLHYKGSGGFDLPDRELRAKCEAIIKAAKERYEAIAPKEMPAWSKATIKLTIKNYDIGTASSAGFKLVGEK